MRLNYKAKDGRGLKILTSKHVLQRLPIALTQVKTVNTSKWENTISVIQNVQKFLDLRKKLLISLKILFCYLKLNTKQHIEGLPKCYLSDKCFKDYQ